MRPDAHPDTILGRCALAGPGHMDAALHAARRAADEWGGSPPDRRAALAEAFRARLRDHADTLTGLLVEEGHPVRLARTEVAGLLTFFGPETTEWCPRQLETRHTAGSRTVVTRRVPDGVVCVQPPRNTPALSVGAAFQSVLAGNALVVRLSRQAPVAAMYLLERIAGPALAEAGASPGLLSALCTDPAQALDAWLASPLVDDVLYFGDSVRGEQLEKACLAAGKKPVLEIGGNDMVLVWRDAPPHGLPRLPVRRADRHPGPAAGHRPAGPPARRGHHRRRRRRPGSHRHRTAARTRLLARRPGHRTASRVRGHRRARPTRPGHLVPPRAGPLGDRLRPVHLRIDQRAARCRRHPPEPAAQPAVDQGEAPPGEDPGRGAPRPVADRRRPAPAPPRHGPGRHAAQPARVLRQPRLLLPGVLRRPPAAVAPDVSRYRAYYTLAPNFGYDWLLRSLKDGRLTDLDRDLDLDCLRCALSGAEPVRPDVLDAVARRLAPIGFRPDVGAPGYGLAEATLMVTGTPCGSGPTVRRFDRGALEASRAVPAPDGVDLVGCGRPAGADVRIVDPATSRPLESGHVGEIWVGGDSVADGYLGDPRATAEHFAAVTADGDGPFLRTGDLGFLRDGELYVTGRAKDLIIINGRNIHPRTSNASVRQPTPPPAPAPPSL
ncbi:hypothetical protein GCM10010365_56450 [Streptomyces poonensis]|uniref:AMP-dependent synthetase/ligase domain-containing protein n=1 Tax=Streptomyces poonensis TaxID=68255 RepID=A0A918Q195_9ACTN|nr:aldehyde dehydrogenase family protein [Streptomyces poonensis]GGZ28951.1 hypothetical protein GCM10010365_56450 [Streptomyces poonensis]